jgi:hypothetical protein
MSQEPDPEPEGQQADSGRPTRQTAVPWIFAGLGLLVVTLAIALVLSLTADDDDGPTGLAHAVVSALNAKDADAMSQLMCHRRSAALIGRVREASTEIQMDASLKGSVTINGDFATATISMNATYRGMHVDQDFELSMAKQGETWCANDLAAPTGR